MLLCDADSTPTQPTWVGRFTWPAICGIYVEGLSDSALSARFVRCQPTNSQQRRDEKLRRCCTFWVLLDGLSRLSFENLGNVEEVCHDDLPEAPVLQVAHMPKR